MSKAMHVLEIGTGVAAAYAARLLGNHGADVIKVEPPEGDPVRLRPPLANGADGESGLFLAINLDKRGVSLDLNDEAGRRSLDSLIEWAHIVVHSLPMDEARALGLHPDAIAETRPDLVVLAMTPFGLSGPYANLSATELTIAHGGGWAGLCPMSHPEPSYPPLKVHGHYCSLMAGVAGAMSALSVYRDAVRSGVGDVIDFSIVEYVASVLEFGIHAYSYHDAVIKRTNPRSLIPWRIFDTRDGAIFLVCIEQDQWERLVAFMGNPDWAQLEVFATVEGRNENQDLVHNFLAEFIAEWNTFELYHAAQQHRICFAPVMTFAQLAADEHLRTRRFFTGNDGLTPSDAPIPDVAGKPSAPMPPRTMAPAYLINDVRPAYRCPAPKLGEHTRRVLGAISPTQRIEGDGNPKPPLASVRVLDLTWVWAGTFCSMNLAHLGADVIRVESSLRPDLYRRGDAAPEGIAPTLNTNGMFNQWNQGKRSVAVDLRSERGIELVKALVAEVDVVVQNFATGVLERLGLGYDVLEAINPRLVLASISGYGQTGPYRHYMGYGPATGPLSGLSSATGFPGEGPEETGVAMPDPTAGITAAYAIVCALARRDHNDIGEHLDITLWESTSALAIEGWMEHALHGTQARRIGNRDPLMSPHGCFPTAGDDEWVTIACVDDAHWQTLRTIIPGLDDPCFDTLEGRKQHEDQLEELISCWTRGLDRWFVTGLLQARGIAAFPSFTSQDIVVDAHFNVRGFIEHLDHPEVGARAHTGIPWRLATRPDRVRTPAPQLGQHTNEVLAEVLGYDNDTIAALHDAGILQ